MGGDVGDGQQKEKSGGGAGRKGLHEKKCKSDRAVAVGEGGLKSGTLLPKKS